jgi:hypothetical protein
VERGLLRYQIRGYQFAYRIRFAQKALKVVRNVTEGKTARHPQNGPAGHAERLQGIRIDVLEVGLENREVEIFDDQVQPDRAASVQSTA